MTAILLIALVATGIMLLLQTKKSKSLTSEISNLKSKTSQEQAELQQQIAKLEEQNSLLSKYQAIIDADGKAAEMLTEATKAAADILSKARAEAETLISSAKAELERSKTAAGEVRENAAKEAQTLKLKADTILKDATIEAAKIIEGANKRAEEIAGKAYEALQKADHLQKTAEAMKNVIEGYGDQYIIPSYTLLDELAEEFGHVEAGQELKKARERMRRMIKDSTAAKCDYVEAYRKATAINFVLDAFNGKVDTIIADVKRDNYGTLTQKIKDAFYLVNNNGKAFRDAVITEEYLQARLEELRWASTVQELKWKEREEQRIIKEQLREEEKARREYEKAIKDAEKEEEGLKKAIEKAQKEVAQATEAQKAKYEAQLKDLNERLQAAEEKNQRALSMAQQTRSGHVYVISNIGSFGEDVYKIGLTRRLEPLDRIRELGDSSVPFEFDVHALMYSENAPTFERDLHKHFLRMQMNKVNPRKEFFRVSLKEIREEIEKLGITAKWTMTAEAREYRESQAIGKSMMNNLFNQEEWEKHQMEIMPAELPELPEEKEV